MTAQTPATAELESDSGSGCEEKTQTSPTSDK